jgi:hypothetical protein
MCLEAPESMITVCVVTKLTSSMLEVVAVAADDDEVVADEDFGKRDLSSFSLGQ